MKTHRNYFGIACLPSSALPWAVVQRRKKIRTFEPGVIQGATPQEFAGLKSDA